MVAVPLVVAWAAMCFYLMVGTAEEPPVVCEEGHVSIQGLDRVHILLLLWINQEARGFGGSFGRRWDEAKEANALARETIDQGYIDYFMGRAIKMDLRENCIDPVLYNRDTTRKAEKTIAWLRSEIKAAAEAVKKKKEL